MIGPGSCPVLGIYHTSNMLASSKGKRPKKSPSERPGTAQTYIIISTYLSMKAVEQMKCQMQNTPETLLQTTSECMHIPHRQKMLNYQVLFADTGGIVSMGADGYSGDLARLEHFKTNQILNCSQTVGQKSENC